MKLVQDQLAEERSTKSSLEARAIGVITSSGALVTLLFALSALVTKSPTYELPEVARIALAATLIAFGIATVLAITAARPENYQEVTVKSLEAVATAEAMTALAREGEPEIAKVLVKIIARARKENGVKARFLQFAVTFEVTAAILLTFAVGTVLLVG
ncbi:hypothetical protein [Kribbella sp. CA-294648]|uniref:hypothetical protein n=1 Tax=Kribbella sp. CA-294648 TaxID=3239948 RepID=UPI003D8FFE68